MADEARETPAASGESSGAGGQSRGGGGGGGVLGFLREHQTVAIAIAAGTLVLTAILVFRAQSQSSGQASTAAGGPGGMPTVATSDTASALNQQNTLLEALANAVQSLLPGSGTPPPPGSVPPPGPTPQGGVNPRPLAGWHGVTGGTLPIQQAGNYVPAQPSHPVPAPGPDWHGVTGGTLPQPVPGPSAVPPIHWPVSHPEPSIITHINGPLS